MDILVLWLQSKYPEVEIQSLMIEPSPRCIRSLKKLTNLRRFKGKFSFLQKAINAQISKQPNSTIELTWRVRYSQILRKKTILKFKLFEDEVLRVFTPL